MFRRPLLLFSLLVAVLVGSAVAFVQSRTFAAMVRSFLERSVPSELGIRGNFTEFGIRLFPPAVSIGHPELKLEPENLLSLPADSVVRAERIDLRFRPLQMLTGHIELQEVRVVGGDISLSVEKAGSRADPRAKRPRGALSWDQLVRIRVAGVALVDSRLSLEWRDEGIRVDLKTREIAAARSGEGSRAAISLDGGIASLAFIRKGRERRVSEVEARARILSDGVEIDSLSADFGTEQFEFPVRMSGRIRGSIIDLRALDADVTVAADGELASLITWAGLSGNKMSGDLSFKGRLKADLLDLDRGLFVEGRTVLEKARVHGWSSEHAEFEGSFDSQAAPSAGKVSLRSGRISLSGGELGIGASTWQLGRKESSNLPITLKDVLLSDLLGPHAASVGNLQMRLGGSLDLRMGDAKEGWRIEANSKLHAPSLSLYSAPGSRESDLVLKAKQPRIEGSFVVEPSRFVPRQLELAFGTSRFKVGGEVSWRGPVSELSWDLQAGGQVDLTDIESLGGSPIEGRGTLQARVHGKGDQLAVDFDTELEEAQYIRLKFGRLAGRISLTEGMQKLGFHKIRARSGTSPYLVDGPIDFRGEGLMALGFEMPSGRVEDFLQIFSPLTSGISWFPESLRGRIRVTGTIGGTLSLSGMDIETRIDGQNWAFLGEQFRAVKFRGGYQRGGYWADDLVAVKRTGSILGRVAYGADERFGWRLRTQNFSLRDFDSIIRLDVPIGGDLALQSEGLGRFDQLESSTQLRVSRVAVRGIQLADSVAEISSRQGSFRADATAMGGQLRLSLTHDPRTSAQNRISVAAESLDFAPLLLLIKPDLALDNTLRARAAGEIDLGYRGANLELASGSLSIRELDLRKKGAAVVLLEPASGKMEGGSISMPPIRIASGSSVAAVKIAADRGSWRTQLSGGLDLSFMEFLVPSVTQASGSALLDFVLSGKAGEPAFSGKAELRGGSVRIAGLDTPIENLAARVSVKQNKWTLAGLQADLAQGRISGSGQMLVHADRLPEIDFSVSLADNRIKAYPFQYLKFRNGNIRISGKHLPYEVAGTLVIDEALSREKLANAGQGIVLQSTLYAPVATAGSTIDFPKFQLKVDIIADSGLRFQNEFLDVEMKARVSVVNTIDAPRIVGRAELVPGQGKLSFKEHVFQIQSAQVVFDNPNAMDPRFELGAVTEISGTKIQLFTSGTAGSYKIDLSSNPVMPESEILSLLALGRTNEESRRLRSTNVSGIQQSEAASLILHSMDFNRDVKEKTGFQIGVGEAMDTNTGASAFRPQADAESTVAPKIVLKRQIGKRVDVSVGSTVGAGATTQREVNADLYLSPSVSVRGVWNYLEGTTTQDAGASQQGRTSFGLDLKLQKRFK
jgi:hypothetical protein